MEWIKLFNPYKYIWTDNRQLCLEYFIKYGQIWTNEQIQSFDENKKQLDGSSPNIEMFKEQVDLF